MPRLTKEQIQFVNRSTRLHAEAIAEYVCDSMAELNIPQSKIEEFYGKLTDSIVESVHIEVEEFDA